jgi:hypothetical protein
MGQAMTKHDDMQIKDATARLGVLPVAPRAMPKQVLEGPSASRLLRRRFLRWIAPVRSPRVGLGR